MAVPWQWLIGKEPPMPEPAAAERKDDLIPALAPWWTAAEFIAGQQQAGLEKAVGLPALLGVLRLISGAAMMMPLIVYKGEELERTRAVGTWQWDLLHKRPYPGVANGASAFRADCFASLAANGKLYIRKLKGTQYVRGASNRTIVGALQVLDPRHVRPEMVNGAMVFHDSTSGQTIDRGPDEVIYIRSFATPGNIEGVAPVTAARIAFETAINRQRFEQAYYKHDARPGIAFEFSDQTMPDDARQWLELYNQEHQGVENAWAPTVLGGGATLKVIPVSAKDAMFVEATQMTAQQIAFMYQIPLPFLEPTRPLTETERSLFVTFALGPSMQALDEGLSNDADLFPDGFADATSVQMSDAALLRPDYANRMAAHKTAIQGAVKTPNEARAEENLPPKPNGDDLQFPVVGGGAVNGGFGKPEESGTSAEAVAKAVAIVLRELKYSPDQPRDDHGRFDFGSGDDSSGGGGGGGGKNPKVKPITAEEARGNSRAVSADEFDRLAEEGQSRLDALEANASPVTALDSHWADVKSNAYSATRESWGGVTVDAHTGEAVNSGYALTAKSSGMSTVSIPEDASQDTFNAAMDTARERFGSKLAYQSHCLGVFHDDDLHRIDIDPVIVVDSTDDVETIGAATHAIGGAYNFADGNGYWPPHVEASKGHSFFKAAQRAYAGIGEWWHEVMSARGNNGR